MTATSTAVETTETAAPVTIENLRLNALKTAEGFDRLATIVDGELGLEVIATHLRERAAKLREGRFTILVVGEFKRGKSTLLNAMLGRDLLPRKAAPCTAILTLLRYGATPKAHVLFNNGRSEPMTPAEFAQKYELKVDDSVGGDSAEAAYYVAMTQDRFQDIDMAEIEYPFELCRHGVELVDTPGLAEHEARERRTLQFLKQADAVIMILDANQPLNQREIAFIHNRLTPLGLKSNLFFLINRWNTLIEGLLDPKDKNEASRAFSEQNQLIDLRLKPLCNVNGVDLSSRRIFKINALGALRERSGSSPSAERLEETQVPAFERSLTRFLVEDRVRARQAIDRNHLAETSATVANHRHIHEENLDKSLDELKANYTKQQPKLDELRRVGVHIKNALSAIASEVADQMNKSFDLHVEKKIREPMKAAVDKFDLGRVEGLFVSFDAALDLIRPEGKKFKDAVTAHLQPQIVGYLRPRVLEWAQTVEQTYLKTVAQRIESELRAEAQSYASILEEVGNSIGGNLKGVGIDEVLKRWLKQLSNPNNSMVDVGMDLAPLMAGVVSDIMSELALHMSAHILPGVGMIVSAVLLLWRRNRMKEKVRDQIYEGMRSKLTEFSLGQHDAIRQAMQVGLAKLDKAIGGKIHDQIAQIDGEMRALIELKESREVDAATRREKLADFQALVDREVHVIADTLESV